MQHPLDDPDENARIEMALAELVANPHDVIGGEWEDNAGYLVWKARELVQAYEPMCWTCFETPDKSQEDCMATTRGEVNCLL